MICTNCTVWYRKAKLEVLSSGFITNDLKPKFPIDLTRMIVEFIALNERIELALLWSEPRVSIEMVSEFMERLPNQHKYKIWLRHATGEYIQHRCILHTLNSFTSLCIKIKDRTAIAPSRCDIEEALTPFVDWVRRRIKNKNGMSLDEFNNEFHQWILEPVTGNYIIGSQEVYELQEELTKVKKEKLHMEGEAQMGDLSKSVVVDYLTQDAIEKDREIVRLQEENKALGKAKMNTILSLANTVDELRETVTVLSKQVEILKNRNKELELRTSKQNVISLSSWIGRI